MEASLEADPPPAPRQVVGELFDRFPTLSTMTDYRAGCPIAAAVVDAGSAGDAVALATADAYRRWTAPLERALARGGLDQARASRVALLVISAVEGALIMSRARRDMEPLDAVATEIDLLLSTT